MYKKGRVNSNSRIVSTDEDPSLRIESSAIINLRAVSTKLNKHIVFTMQTYKKLIKSNNCFIIDFKPKIINMARKTIKNKPRRLNMQITELSVSPITMHKTTAIYTEITSWLASAYDFYSRVVEDR